MKRKIFISYKRIDENAQGEDSTDLADQLRGVLASDYEVLQDKQIGPGEAWQRRIGENLAACEAAVALLSPAALTSPWVMHELSVLSNRALTSNPPLPLLIALVRGSDPAALEAGTFRAMNLARFQQYLPAVAGEEPGRNHYLDEPHLLRCLVTRLQEVLPATPDSPRRRLIMRVMQLLDPFRFSFDELETVLAPGAGPLELRLQRLAQSLLLANSTQLTKAIQILVTDDAANVDDKSKIHTLINLVFPFWVDATDAALLGTVHAAGKFPALDVRLPWTVEQYVKRAEESPKFWRKLELSDEASERPDACLEQLTELLCDELLGDGELETTAQLTFEHKLEVVLAAEVGLQIFFPTVHSTVDAARLLGLDRPWIRPVLMGRADPNEERAIALSPLETGAEERQSKTYGRLMKAGNHGK